MDTLEESVVRVIAAQLDKDIEDIDLSQKFVEDLGADSLDIAETIMAIEEEFGCEIPDEDAENMRTVQDVCDFLAQQQSQ